MSRSVEVIAVQLWSTLDRSPDENRAHALFWMERAAAKKPDLILMPESVSMLCYPDGRPGFTYRDVAETVPGPFSEAVSKIAATHQTNIVVGIVESGEPCQNTALVFNRAGELVGNYQKTHEPEICRTEQHAAVGSELPVFQLDFGRIGIFVCWDLESPEISSLLALKGAEILCFPHMIALPTTRNFSYRIRARAIDSGRPIVAAGMRDAHNHAGHQDGLYPTCILDHQGEVLKQIATAGPGICEARLSIPDPNDHSHWANRRRREINLPLYASEYARFKE